MQRIGDRGCWASRAETVVIPTIGRLQTPTETLDGVRGLSLPRLAILIGGNRSGTSGTRDFVDAQRAKDPRVRYVTESRPGRSGSRNQALAEAQGEIDCLLGHDVRVDEAWPHALVNPLVADAAERATTGLVRLMRLEMRAQYLLDAYGGFRMGLTERRLDLGAALPQGVFCYPYRGRAFGRGARMAARRDLARSLGGFDLSMGTTRFTRSWWRRCRHPFPSRPDWCCTGIRSSGDLPARAQPDRCGVQAPVVSVRGRAGTQIDEGFVRDRKLHGRWPARSSRCARRGPPVAPGNRGGGRPSSPTVPLRFRWREEPKSAAPSFNVPAPRAARRQGPVGHLPPPSRRGSVAGAGGTLLSISAPQPEQPSGRSLRTVRACAGAVVRRVAGRRPVHPSARWVCCRGGRACREHRCVKESSSDAGCGTTPGRPR